MFALRSTLSGRTTRAVASKISQRQMGGGGNHAAKEWTGIDKVVRGYFPEDYQRTCLQTYSIRRFSLSTL
jgi:hypothetical protein